MLKVLCLLAVATLPLEVRQPLKLDKEVIQQLVPSEQVSQLSDVASLIELLGHNDFATRQAAESRLLELGSQSWVVECHLQLHHPDVHVKLATRQILERLCDLRVAQFDLDPEFTCFPSLDTLWYNTRNYTYRPWSIYSNTLYFQYNRYISEAMAGDGDKTYPHPCYRQATKAAFRDARRDGVPTWVLHLVSMEMYRRDYFFYENLETKIFCVPLKYPWKRPTHLPEWMFFRCYDVEGLFHVLTHFPR